MNVRFSVMDQAIQSLVTSIWVWEVSGMAEKRSIKVRTMVSWVRCEGGGWRVPILAVLALAKFDMMVLDVLMRATSLSTCLEHC